MHFALLPMAVIFCCSAIANLDFTFQQSQPNFPDGHPTSLFVDILPVVILMSLFLLLSKYLKNYLCNNVSAITSLTPNSCLSQDQIKAPCEAYIFSPFISSLVWCQKEWSKLSLLSSFNTPWHIYFSLVLKGSYS